MVPRKRRHCVEVAQLLRRELRSVKRNKAVLGARTGMILGQMIIYGLLFWQVLAILV